MAWTAERFGTREARVYATTVTRALVALTAGPTIVGVRTREDLGSGVATLHVARARRKGRHIIVLRVPPDGGENVIEILRILHDTMDLARHLEPHEDA
jgi:toxin ParE1/3/4